MKSMTGFGYAEGAGKLGFYKIRLKTLNHRFLDLNCRIPREMSIWEDKITSLVRENISRGKVEVRVEFEPQEGAFSVEANMVLARSYWKALQKIVQELSLLQQPGLSDLLQAGEIVQVREQSSLWEEEWENFYPLFKEALCSLISYREAEGAHLREDLLSWLKELERLTGEVEKGTPLVQSYYRNKLLQRIEEFLPGVKIDEALLAQEVIFYVEKSDINEEIVRLKAHINRMNELLSQDKAMGRELEFILQEMNREVNTIGSKSSQVEISSLVVEMKTVIEKMWEQVRNVE
ncbi:MAG TPA: YicC family protein [Candidatus Atribacteria bacterium]|nr:YicC family protein [Candidatus Atribacteria bacterium]HQE25468.1 YicC family protein [Candidatus Atribacteria bacterium]